MPKKRRTRRRKSSTPRRKTSRRRSIRRRVRRAGSRIKRGTKKRSKSIVSMVTNIIPPVASVQLLSHNQLSALPEGASMGDKVKAIANGLTGSIMDFNIFDDAPQAHVHFDIEGAFNQWTAIGGAGIIGGLIGKKIGLPHSSKFASFGKKLLPAGIIAGSLGFKNNNPTNHSDHSPFFQKKTTTTRQVFTPRVTSNVSSGGSGVA